MDCIFVEEIDRVRGADASILGRQCKGGLVWKVGTCYFSESRVIELDD